MTNSTVKYIDRNKYLWNDLNKIYMHVSVHYCKNQVKNNVNIFSIYIFMSFLLHFLKKLLIEYLLSVSNNSKQLPIYQIIYYCKL